MREIKFKKIMSSDKLIVYLVLINNEEIGKIYITNDKDESYVKYNFSKKEFNGLFGSFLMDEVLHKALLDFNHVGKSNISFKDSCDIDNYKDHFKIDKDVNGDRINYSLRR